MRRPVVLVATLILALQSVGCGTLIYPERRGQTGGQIDPGIAILDAAGLLVFVVPGLVAFGVDFVTGAIYLPGGKKASAEEPLRMIILPPEDLNLPTLEELVAEETGQPVDLRSTGIQTMAVADRESLETAVLRAN